MLKQIYVKKKCSKHSLGDDFLNDGIIKYAFINCWSTHLDILRIGIISIRINIMIISSRKHTDLQAKG